MHEISLCESILEIMQERAGADGFTQVKQVWLEIGKLSCVEPDAMKFGFDSVVHGSLAEGAQLQIIWVPGRARCLSCLHEVEIEQYGDLCPDCGNSQLQVMDGDQLRIKEMEVV